MARYKKITEHQTWSWCFNVWECVPQKAERFHPLFRRRNFIYLTAMVISSRFLTLPAEVRLLIYVHIFAGAVLRPRYRLRLRSKSTPEPASKTTAILTTCRLCQVEVLPVFFNTCKFKLMTSADKHAFLSSVPVSHHVSVQHLILNAPVVLYDWDPRFLSRNFPSLRTVEVLYFEVWNRNLAVTQATAEDSNKCAAIVRENLTKLANLFTQGRNANVIGNAISRHTTQEWRSYVVVLRTILNFAFPREIRYVVSRGSKQGRAWLTRSSSAITISILGCGRSTTRAASGRRPGYSDPRSH